MQAVLFDLDGTLLDTGRDMGNALNRLLDKYGRTTIPYTRIRPNVSHGAGALLKLGFGTDAGDPEFEGLRRQFLDYYEQDLCSNTQLFEGTSEVLTHLDQRNLPWGIVTNKPEYLTRPLLDSFGLLARAACVVGGDTLSKRKPHPAPLLYGCSLTGKDPADCIYVGDAKGDIDAGRGAGMKTLVATFGYLSAQDEPEDWGADGMIEHPREILNWI
jgi:phosphoglycolate phosphatase